MVGEDADWSSIWERLKQLDGVAGEPDAEPTSPQGTPTADPPLAELPSPPPEDAQVAPTLPTSATTPPRGDLSSLFSTDDYPASALRNREEGLVRARLSVGLDGRVRDCTVMRSSGSTALDSTTCEIFVRRARFDPARDASGNAVEASILTPPVRWVIPD